MHILPDCDASCRAAAKLLLLSLESGKKIPRTAGVAGAAYYLAIVLYAWFLKSRGIARTTWILATIDTRCTKLHVFLTSLFLSLPDPPEEDLSPLHSLRVVLHFRRRASKQENGVYAGRTSPISGT